MRYHDHTGSALYRVVAASVDVDLLQRRWRMCLRLNAEHIRIDREAQAREDQRIVAEREARVAVRRIVERTQA